MSEEAVTCQIRYTLNLNELSAFKTYARTWIALIERYGGIHHGYFLPRAAPDGVGVSFPGLGQDGPDDVAVAMFTFPDEESYRRYREVVATDPECRSAAALVEETKCFTRYERLFLRPLAVRAHPHSQQERSSGWVENADHNLLHSLCRRSEPRHRSRSRCFRACRFNAIRT